MNIRTFSLAIVAVHLYILYQTDICEAIYHYYGHAVVICYLWQGLVADIVAVL